MSVALSTRAEKRRLMPLCLILLPLLLPACGGGGGGTGAAGAPTLGLDYARNRILRFSWNTVPGADGYRLLENPDGGSGYAVVATLPATATGYDLEASLPDRLQAGYQLEACSGTDCTGSSETFVDPAALKDAIGYLKAGTPVGGETLGYGLALSADGRTLAAGAPFHAYNAATPNSGAVRIFLHGSAGAWSEMPLIEPPTPTAGAGFGRTLALSADGNVLAVGAPNQSTSQGAVFLYRRNQGAWTLEAQLQAGNPDTDDVFGTSLALSADGSLLAVGARREDGSGTGVNATPNNSANDTGAVYIFRNTSGWTQEAYIKSNNPQNYDYFGTSVALSADGNTLAVGAIGESTTAGNSGAVFIFDYDTNTGWSQQTRLKAANAGVNDNFGNAVALSADGRTLAVAAVYEGSDTTGIDGGYNNNADDSGAVYLFEASGSTWTQTAFVKASNTQAFDYFGTALALSPDGDTLIVGAYGEDSQATGFDGDGSDNGSANAGAAYQFRRDATGWRQIAYLKPPVVTNMGYFGITVAAASGITAAGSPGENSGKPDDPTDTSASSSGAIFVY